MPANLLDRCVGLLFSRLAPLLQLPCTPALIARQHEIDRRTNRHAQEYDIDAGHLSALPNQRLISREQCARSQNLMEYNILFIDVYV